MSHRTPGKAGGTVTDKLIGEEVQIFDTLVPINGNSFAAEDSSNKNAVSAA